jgi:hypothetical protein
MSSMSAMQCGLDIGVGGVGSVAGLDSRSHSSTIGTAAERKKERQLCVGFHAATRQVIVEG